jgi:hypothetical protein
MRVDRDGYFHSRCVLLPQNLFDEADRLTGVSLVFLVATGGTFTNRPQRPDEMFLDGSYVARSTIPIMRRASELGLLWEVSKIPNLLSLMVNMVMKDLSGYAVHLFTYDSTDG